MTGDIDKYRINKIIIYTVPGPGRRDLQAKEELPQGPPEILLLLLNFQFEMLEKKENRIK